MSLKWPAGRWKCGSEAEQGRRGLKPQVSKSSAEAGEIDAIAQENMKGRKTRGPGAHFLPQALLLWHLPPLGVVVPPVSSFADASVQPLSLAHGSSLSHWVSAGTKRSYWFPE